MTTRTSLPSGIRDNLTRGSVGEFLKSKIVHGSQLSVVSAYFTIYAYEKLKPELNQIDNLRFLFGEPSFVRALDPSKTDKKAFRIEDDTIRLANALEQKRIARECAEWIQARVEIKSVLRAGLLHGKMYHISDHGKDSAILGSSNFTVHGLGLADGSNNIELNLIVDGNRDIQDLKAWFDDLWSDEKLVADVKAEVLRYLEQLYQNHPPEFIYFKTLYHLFENFLAEQTKGGLLEEARHIADTDIWRALFEFQRDGVKGAINKINKHEGCIIADSVGLGKTYTALAVIKYFEMRNARVLVLCPKKLRENWTVYQAHAGSTLNPFPRDRFSYTVLSHTDLSRDGGKSGDIDLANFNWGAYDLLVIDESHNFRNNTPGKVDEQGKVHKSRYQRLMEDVLTQGVKTKVLMLTATPVNTDLTDLRNQLYLISEGKDDAFQEKIGIPSLKTTLNVAQTQFNAWAKRPGERDTRDLLQNLNSGFFTLLDELTIARSRKHIQRYYADSIAALGGFPHRAKPHSIYPNLDAAGEFMSYDQLNSGIENYHLSLFYPSKYVRAEYKSTYEKKVGTRFSQSQVERYLVGMMKVNFLKRLESSIKAFEITMERTLNKIHDLQERIARFKTLQAASPTFNSDELEELLEDDEELDDLTGVGEKLRYPFAELDLDRWLTDLKKDEEQIAFLYTEAQKVTPERDAKLAELKQLIQRKAQHPTFNKDDKPNRKVLVFSAFADTACYLYDQLVSWAHDELGIHVALVTGGNDNRATLGKTEFNQILTNFSPVSKKRAQMIGMRQDSEIDLLIATDCISEGQNLQDCDYLVNYDIHWNPVRVIQRFGRIDRIGSRSSEVQLVNFWPTRDLDRYITLKARVEARMALVDISATSEDNILDTAQLEELVKGDLKYRDHQLLKLKDQVLDLEDFNETVSLTDFTLDDFRIDLANYIEANRQVLEDAPLGLYAVVPPDPDHSIIQPGVIYCLRQKDDAATKSGDSVNPLKPYFLVYVRDDRTVRYGFTNPKQILEMYRTLCVGKRVPYQELCDLFDHDTHNGADMQHYDQLLKLAIADIAKRMNTRIAGGLQTDRSFVIPPRAAQPDYELITWLVIK